MGFVAPTDFGFAQLSTVMTFMICYLLPLKTHRQLLFILTYIGFLIQAEQAKRMEHRDGLRMDQALVDQSQILRVASQRVPELDPQ